MRIPIEVVQGRWRSRLQLRIKGRGNTFSFSLVSCSALTPCQLGEKWRKLLYTLLPDRGASVTIGCRCREMVKYEGKRLFVLGILQIKEDGNMLLPLSFISVLTALSQWLAFILNMSERLPKRYSSVLKWGNLHSPAYPLLLASWLACSHLLSKSIHPLSRALSALFPLALLLRFSSILSMSAIFKAGSYRLNTPTPHTPHPTPTDFLLSVPWLGPARQRCPVWPNWGIMRQVFLPQPPSHSVILYDFHLSSSNAFYLCMEQIVYPPCQNKIWPKRSHLFFLLCCHYSFFLSPSQRERASWDRIN